MKIISLDVDFSGNQNIHNAISIQNEYLELLQESEEVDNEHIASAIQHYCDDNALKEGVPVEITSTKIISVFINKEFHRNFELHAEVCVIHTATVIEGLQ
ncbi:hypothetical protein QDS01_18315 [Acinetobacter nosocomialis]|uniref:hypothetical protein n=1 Tax=Acinetobacter nosocomialis TaxID=106654 RepID=UPI0024489618|nr:hypothetical protein [Acinetobacter nosocomialis]MDH2636868.1 hypothetical protein [Acinetobacter nosocomialis]